MSDSPAILDPAKLRRRRIEAGLNQIDLAERTGLHRSHIGFLEKGRRGTTARTLSSLAEALGCRIADLMPDEKAA